MEKEKEVRSRVPSVPHAPTAQMPTLKRRGWGAAHRPHWGLGSSSNQAASRIQVPPSPTPESVPNRFLSRSATTTQVCILKKAAGHRAVCKTVPTILTMDHLSHCVGGEPGTLGLRPKPGDTLSSFCECREACSSRGGVGGSHCLHLLPLGTASRLRTRGTMKILLKGL